MLKLLMDTELKCELTSRNQISIVLPRSSVLYWLQLSLQEPSHDTGGGGGVTSTIQCGPTSSFKVLKEAGRSCLARLTRKACWTKGESQKTHHHGQTHHVLYIEFTKQIFAELLIHLFPFDYTYKFTSSLIEPLFMLLQLWYNSAICV